MARILRGEYPSSTVFTGTKLASLSWPMVRPYSHSTTRPTRSAGVTLLHVP